MNVSIHPEADDEFAGAVSYYSQISPELGVRFYREMERLLMEVSANPDRFRKFDRQHADTSAKVFPTQLSSSINQIMFASLP